MPQEVHDELEDIEPQLQSHSHVLAVSVGILRALEKWKAMARKLRDTIGGMQLPLQAAC